VNADLANNLGNLLNRTLTMAGKFCGGHVPAYTDTSPLTTDKGDVVEFRPITAEDLAAIADAYEQFQFQTASERIIELVDRGNKLIHQAEPWALAKVERHDDVERVLYAALESLRQVAIVLSPITPTLCAEIFTQLGYLTGTLETQTWADVLTSPLPSGQALKPAGPILPRLEDELVGAGGKKK
jgi:methionyl-tRNA synthetase